MRIRKTIYAMILLIAMLCLTACHKTPSNCLIIVNTNLSHELAKCARVTASTMEKEAVTYPMTISDGTGNASFMVEVDTGDYQIEFQLDGFRPQTLRCKADAAINIIEMSISAIPIDSTECTTGSEHLVHEN